MKGKRVIKKPSDSVGKRLREIAWEVGQRYPLRHTTDYISLHAVTPRLGFIHWHVRGKSADAARARRAATPDFAVPVGRIYDVTDIIFNGDNAHTSIDLDLGSLQGGHYFRIERQARNYLAEIGLRAADGSFVAIERSQAVFFDREQPSGNYQAAGMFVGRAGRRFRNTQDRTARCGPLCCCSPHSPTGAPWPSSILLRRPR